MYKHKMESPDRALSCQIHIKRVAVTKIKEADRKWADELKAGYSLHITIAYTINVAFAIARLHSLYMNLNPKLSFYSCCCDKLKLVCLETLCKIRDAF